MPVARIDSPAALPRSHCFLSFSYGQTIRTVRLRTGSLRTALGIAGMLCLWLIGSSLYLVFHDDLVASLMAREATAQYAYEDRISALRGQVEREASLKLVGQTRLDGKLKELVERTAALEARAGLLAEMTSRAGGLTVAGRSSAAALLPAPNPASAPLDDTLDRATTGAISAAPKPHPEIDGAASGPARLSTSAADLPSFDGRLATVVDRLEHIDDEQIRSLGLVQSSARHRAETLRSAILSAGLSPERLTSRAGVTPSLGGPFVPLDSAVMRSPFGKALEAMQADIGTAASLTQAMPHLPFAKPLTGALDVTSPFGARLDPFLGRPAMHTGVDLREDYGTEVRATADGRVVSAGPAGGYGTMIEIDHGYGLSTRYAHLSSVGVSPGQAITKGEVIGEVGATGRATGPHLHYETRIDGEAVDPERFLMAGTRLAAAL